LGNSSSKKSFLGYKKSENTGALQGDYLLFRINTQRTTRTLKR